MPTNFDPKARTIGEVLANNQLTVPDWQRPFAWKTSHVQAFWNDINDFSSLYPAATVTDKHYFLGSVVFVKGEPLQVLDGQQRLATSVILLSVIRDFLKTSDSKGAHAIQTTFLASYNISAQAERDNLLLSEFDRDFFSSIIVRDSSLRPDPKLTSHNDILAARSFFVTQFERQRDTTSGDAFFNWCRRLQRILCEHCSVIEIISEDEDAAASIFETLNDRGLGLSTVDLLRNFLLRNAQAADRDAITAAWGDILEDAIGFDISQFLRHYWISKHGDVKSQGLYKEIKAKLIADNTSSLSFSQQLQEAADDYAALVKARSTDPELKKLYADINLLDATVLYPALLSASSTYAVEQIEKILDVARTMLNAFVRHNVVAGREASQFETQAYEIARQLRKDVNLAYIPLLQPLMPSADEFEAAFKNLLPRRTAWARYLLATIEQRERGYEETLLGPSSTLHVEHIYPQNPSFAKWPDHSQWVGRLGNLTLLGRRLNTQASNSRFVDKKPKYADSKIEMTKELSQIPDWSPDTIVERQAKLFNTAVQVWPTF
jgi:uncharacterized protein with ParB-like and HNH nuclease domain